MPAMRRLLPITALALSLAASVSASDQNETAGADEGGSNDGDKSGATQPGATNIWSYNGNDTNPSMWPEMGFPQCGGGLQSPINIETEKCDQRKIKKPLAFHLYDKIAKKITVRNNGHTLVATFDYEGGGVRPRVSGGELPGSYVFQQLHFHWGENSEGSEHTIDGKRAPLEMHIVHMNAKHKSMAQAAKDPDGIVVLAVYFETSTNVPLPLLTSVDSVSRMVTPFNGSATLKPRALRSVLPKNLNAFYRYRGSLTTPGCQESVIWTVFEKPDHVIIAQLQMLYKLQREDGEKLVENFRPVQKTNGRKIVHMVYTTPKTVKAISACQPSVRVPTVISAMILTAAPVVITPWY